MNETEQRLVAILDGIDECFYALDRSWRITVFNRGSEMFFGRPRAEMLGQSVRDALRIDAVPALEAAFSGAMAGQASENWSFSSPARPDRWLEGRVFPLPDGIGVAFRDVTERRADEAALRRREAELARVQRIAGVGGLEVELGRGFANRRSPEYLRLHGLTADAAFEPHEDWVRRIHPEDRERAERAFKDAVIGTATTYAAEYRIIRPSDGETRWIMATAEIERGPDGRAIRLVGAHRDVTERKRAEAQQRLLINELNHRVKNTLATVQSIASQSLRATSGGPEAWAAFDARLRALARAHDILTRESWEGADLGDIVRDAAEPYGGLDGQRLRAEGVAVRLAPATALVFAMALQELAANAARHGALTVPAGRVGVSWSVVDAPARRLRMHWAESDGPPVAPPSHRGFGLRLIERGFSHGIDGVVSLEFAETGIVCTVEAPLPALDPARGSVENPRPAFVQ